MKKVWLAFAGTAGFAAGFGGGALQDRSGAHAAEDPRPVPSASAWPTLEELPPIGGERAANGAMTPVTQVAPVQSLLVGLEARLAAQPDDASGWALLAQSYAFVGNAAAAEAAVGRAVALGFDEHDLRKRVGHAQREPASGDWIEQMIGVKRQ